MAHILLVDDDSTNIELASAMLEQAGHQVQRASSGEAGIAMASTTLPDLMLLDVQMPGMDGVEALRRLRADVRTAGLKVVVLTALAMKGDRERLLAAGFDAYVEKPIRYKAFLAAIELALGRPGDGD